MTNKIIERKTQRIKEEKEDKINIFLYHTILGRIILKILITKPISKIYGYYLDSKLSIPKIKKYCSNFEDSNKALHCQDCI